MEDKLLVKWKVPCDCGVFIRPPVLRYEREIADNGDEIGLDLYLQKNPVCRKCGKEYTEEEEGKR